MNGRPWSPDDTATLAGNGAAMKIGEFFGALIEIISFRPVGEPAWMMPPKPRIRVKALSVRGNPLDGARLWDNS